MGNILNSLYSVQKKDFVKSGKIFGSSFENDPAFHDFFKDDDDKKRDAFFEGPARYCYRYGKIYATSFQMEGLAAWVTGNKADMTFWRILRSGLVKSTHRVGIKKMMSMRPVFEPLDKARRRIMKGRDYIYLMTLGVAPQFQGLGYGGTLLRAVIEDSESHNLPLYLETATEKNVEMYKKIGFNVIEQVMLHKIKIPLWCMIRECSD